MFKIRTRVRDKEGTFSGEIRGFGQLINKDTNEPQTIALIEIDAPFYSDESAIRVTILAADITNLELEPTMVEIDGRD